MTLYGTSGIGSTSPLPGSPTTGRRESQDQGFAGALREAVEKVNQLHQASGQEVQKLLTGESEDLHRTLLAVERSELAFELMMEVRNKVVQAYQEILRIQV